MFNYVAISLDYAWICLYIEILAFQPSWIFFQGRFLMRTRYMFAPFLPQGKGAMRMAIVVIAMIAIPLSARTENIDAEPHASEDLSISYAAIIEQLQVCLADTTQILVESTKCVDSKARIGCVAGFVNSPIDRVWEMATDYRGYAQLIPRCTRSLIVSSEIIPSIIDPDEFPSSMDISEYAVERLVPCDTTLVYSEIDIIFPVGRIRSLLEITSDSINHTICWRKLASDIRIHEGAWQFIPCGDRTIVVCLMRYRLNVWLPPFLIHGAVHYYLPQIIRGLRQRVSQKP